MNSTISLINKTDFSTQSFSVVYSFCTAMAGIIKVADFLGFPLRSLKATGFDPMSDGSDKSLKAKAMTFYRLFFVSSVVLVLLSCAISIYKNFNDFDILSRIFTSLILLMIVSAKVLAILGHEKMFKRTVEIIKKLFAENNDELFQFLACRQLLKLRRIENIFLLIGIISNASLVIGVIFNVMFTGVWIQKLPVDFWFPFDEYDPKYYSFVLLWFLFFAATITSSMCGANLLLFCLISIVTVLFEKLCHRTKNLNLATQEIEKEIKCLVELHCDLIKVCNNIERIFSLSLLVDFIGSSFVICSIVFQVLHGLQLESSIEHGIWMLIVLCQTLSLCLSGTKLSDASEKPSNAIYNCRWNDCSDKRLKHLVLMMTMRSQKPCVLTAHKFSTISLKVFKSVIKIRYLCDIDKNKWWFLFCRLSARHSLTLHFWGHLMNKKDKRKMNKVLLIAHTLRTLPIYFRTLRRCDQN